MNLFAQATNTPGNGASNSQDFQPLTRNPQTTGGGLQPGTVPQSTTSQDILSNGNARITVPVSNVNGATSPPPVVDSGGINWLLVFIVAAVVVFVFEYGFRRRDKRSHVQTTDFDDSSYQEVIEYPVDESESPEVPKELNIPGGILEPQVTPNEPKPSSSSSKSKSKKKNPPKSKSKRKKTKK